MASFSLDKILMKAKTHIKHGEVYSARQIYEEILKRFPRNKRAKKGLMTLLNSSKVPAKKSSKVASINILLDLYNKGDFKLVVEKAQRLTEKCPKKFELWNILGAAYKELGEIGKASEAFKKVTKLNPSYAFGYNNLGIALVSQAKLDEAIVAFQKALSLDPKQAEILNSMGNILKDQGKLDEAITAYKKALSIEPNQASTYNNIGSALQEKGKLDEAITAYKKALSLKADHTEAHLNLSRLVKYDSNSSQIAIVQQLMNCPNLNDVKRCHLNYTYAKMKEDLGDISAAFENYVAGGALRQKAMGYDQMRDKRLFMKIKNATLKLKNFPFHPSVKETDVTPIFILGMPRSGTTLVEQIISSHSKVKGAGELKFLSGYAGAINCGEQSINSDTFPNVRKFYLDELTKVSSGKKFVTDKLPQNFLYIGLIFHALPKAKIVHVKRDPAATCWSNFKHYFNANGLGYSYNLKDTVSYFKLYRDLMEYWDKQFGMQIYHLDYEKLTFNQEDETKKLLAYLGLPMEEMCLCPHENRRSVKTSSNIKVREKIYKGSSKDWYKFQPFLDGIFDKLIT